MGAGRNVVSLRELAPAATGLFLAGACPAGLALPAPGLTPASRHERCQGLARHAAGLSPRRAPKCLRAMAPGPSAQGAGTHVFSLGR
ncbi:hypothetical protein OIU77_001962 [Salix suchowensis]|uniref:Uncharacterized protein n=1 Tax=Salix suchowensis TaxID=1278906 RepID=A0ABQ9B3F1_9ROSI|nr:hypothetical protein OIU77_001962 [Salix suchowensis]